MRARGAFCATIGRVTEETLRNYIENQDIEKDGDSF
jgi:putative transposase